MPIPNYDEIYSKRREKSEIIKRHLRTYEGMTHINRNPEGILAFRKAISKLELENKKLLVNNIGMGAEILEGGHINTYEPYELANAAIKEGAKPDVIGYTLSEEKAETLSKCRKIIVPADEEHRIKGNRLAEEIGKVSKEKGLTVIEPHEEIKKAVRFGSMDILNSAPVRRAHVTYFMNVFPHIENSQEKRAALRNLSESTLKGGFILTDKNFDEKILLELGLEKVKLGTDKPNRYALAYKKVKEIDY